MNNYISELAGSVPELIRNSRIDFKLSLEGWPAAVAVSFVSVSGAVVLIIKALQPEADEISSAKEIGSIPQQDRAYY